MEERGNPLAKTTDKIYYFAQGRSVSQEFSWSLLPLSFLQLGHSYFCSILISGVGIGQGKVVISANRPSGQVCSGEVAKVWRQLQVLTFFRN